MNRIPHRTPIFLAFLLTALAACTREPAAETRENDEQIAAAIRSVMDSQQNAWNRGDIEGFMAGYARADTTTFVSGDELTRGWKTVLDRYKQHYKSRDEMGTLSFSELEIKPIGRDLAVADGRWKLSRAADTPHGRFTLLFQRMEKDWRIVHDTTTSAGP
jgi:ketosteroid isomerase-like protein